MQLMGVSRLTGSRVDPPMSTVVVVGLRAFEVAVAAGQFAEPFLVAAVRKVIPRERLTVEARVEIPRNGLKRLLDHRLAHVFPEELADVPQKSDIDLLELVPQVSRLLNPLTTPIPLDIVPDRCPVHRL